MGDITAAPHEPVAGGPRMKLHHFFRSSASFRVRIALNLKEISWEAVSVDLRAVPPQQRSAEFLALNPLGLVPVLTDQSSAFTQSLAIIEYLEETFPKPALLPKQAADRARARSLALAIACDIHPLGNLRILNYLRSEYQRDEDSVNAWVRRWVGDGFSALEIQAQALGDGRHLFGASVTLADICLFPQMYNARRFGCDLTPYPTLGAVCAHLQTISAFANAAPEAFGAITSKSELDAKGAGCCGGADFWGSGGPKTARPTTSSIAPESGQLSEAATCMSVTSASPGRVSAIYRQHVASNKASVV